MVRQVRNITGLDKRNSDDIALGTRLASTVRNILGLNHRAGEYASGIIKTSVQDPQLDNALTGVRAAEVLLRKASMLQ